MPKGKGTYGSKVGRPPKKMKKNKKKMSDGFQSFWKDGKERFVLQH
jgi:hypothetical protein